MSLSLSPDSGVARLRSGALIASAFIMPLLGLVAPLGIATQAIVVALLVATAVWREQSWFQINGRPVALLLLIALLGAASALWAISPLWSFETALRFLALTVAGVLVVASALRLTTRQGAMLGQSLLVGVGLLGALLLFDNESGGRLGLLFASIKQGREVEDIGMAFHRGAVVLALLSWPLALFLLRRWGKLAALALLLLVFGVLTTGSNWASKVAMLAGFVALAAVWLLPRPALAALRIGVAVLILGMPFAAASLPSPQHIFESWHNIGGSTHHRLTIWAFSAHKALEKPMLGWGMDASRDMPGGEDRITVRRFDSQLNEPLELHEQQLPLHPHNAAIQWWLELGAVGALLFTLFVTWLLGWIGRLPLPPIERALLVGQVLSALVVATVSFGLWQAWWQAALWLAVAFSVTALGLRDGRKES